MRDLGTEGAGYAYDIFIGADEADGPSRLMAEYGMKPADVIRSATSVTARILGLA